MRLKLTLAYVGTAYHGWQRQPREATIQGLLEAAAGRVATRVIAVTGAGRTDAGVHAAGQVAHMDVGDRLEPQAWKAALNARLPADVRVLACEPVSAEFHARYGVRSKTYRYCIDDSPVASPFLAPFAWHVRGRLDERAMREAGNYLQGDVDQRAFATQPEPDDTLRPIDQIELERDRLLSITVVGRSFLRYAVRGIVGTLVEVGRGRRDPETLAQLASSGDRSAAGATAPPHGLCLVRVEYAERHHGPD